jgi:hypothetical protein
MLLREAYVLEAAAQQPPADPQSSQGSAQEYTESRSDLLNMFGLDCVPGHVGTVPLIQHHPQADTSGDLTGGQHPAKLPAQAAQTSRVSLCTPTVSHRGFVGLMACAASPGVLLQVLQYHGDELSTSQYSTAYARLPELCRENPSFLPHPDTHWLLQLLKWKLPRMQQHVRPCHLAIMSAGSIQLQQPEVLRVMLPRLLQHPQLQPAQLGLSVVVCFSMEQQPLAQALLRLLLQDEQLFACDSRGQLSSLAAITASPALQLKEPQQQQLLEALVEVSDRSSAQQVTAALWLAAGAVPAKREPWELLLDAFMQVLPQASLAAVAAVLASATAARWELPAGQLEQLLAAAEQQLSTADAVAIRLTYEAAVYHRLSTNALLQQNHRQLYSLLMAFHQQSPTSDARDVYGILSAAAVAGAWMPVATLQVDHQIHKTVARIHSLADCRPAVFCGHTAQQHRRQDSRTGCMQSS